MIIPTPGTSEQEVEEKSVKDKVVFSSLAKGK
jgi:hypothetical protein